MSTLAAPFMMPDRSSPPMQIEDLLSYLDDPAAARPWLESLGLEDWERGHRNLVALAQSRMTLDLVAIIARQLAKYLPSLSDPDMALNNFASFFDRARNPLALGALMERDADALPTLLQIISTSQYLADLLIRDPESFDLLRLTEGQPVARNVLVDEVASEIDRALDDRAALSILRRYKQRETLRIAYGDIIRGQSIEIVSGQISFLADALCEAALRYARRQLEERRGVPKRPDGQRARFVTLALGKLGGVELNYSSDIDVVFLCDDEGATDGERPITNTEFFGRLVVNTVKLLTEPTEHGTVYRVDLRLRPDGGQGQPVHGVNSALQYYDTHGRTWERQAFVKARPIAGDLDLGNTFLRRLEPWVYRAYLTRADISGIRALKRRIAQRAIREGADRRDVKTGHGGLRDIEFTIQFLQLLNGAEAPELRVGNTIDGIRALQQIQVLTFQEGEMLERNYSFLRKVEHRLQVMFDLQTHLLPESDLEMRRLAIRMGYADAPAGQALARFRRDLERCTTENRAVLDHLLQNAFGESEEIEPEVDLVLDPEPADEFIESVLAPYGFADVPAAYRNLMALAIERVPFLSTRRCRHFLAAIAPTLLRAIKETPDPDLTLVNLCAVSDAVGGKAVLWGLFSSHSPSLQLYVRLCASSPYLSGILTTHPGMIDELMDSLLLDKLPTLEHLGALLRELLRGAEDPEPILHSFKNSHHLSVGVRDILGKEDLRNTHRALSDIAEVCLREIATRELDRLSQRYGEPTIPPPPPVEPDEPPENAESNSRAETNANSPRPRRPATSTDSASRADDAERACDFVILAMGKLGGREPNYHSDLDVIFLYEEDGYTRPDSRSRRSESTSNQHFFSQLGQRIIKEVTHIGPYGRLYEMDPRLRPTGKSGALACSLTEFTRYFAEGQGQLWERQALCKARPVFGSAAAQAAAMDAVRRAITVTPWQPSFASDIRVMRRRMEETAAPRNMKRGPGGTVDIEFLVQMLQLKCAAAHPEVLAPGTQEAIAAVRRVGSLAAADADAMTESYRLLRSVKSGLRLMNTAALHDLPTEERELRRLAFLLRYPSHHELVAACLDCMAENRRRFERLFAEAAAE